MSGGILAAPTLNGVHLGRTPGGVRMQQVEVKSLLQTAGGGVVEQRGIWLEGVINLDVLTPTRKVKHTLELDFQHLSDAQRVEELLAEPGPHRISVWKSLTVAYVCDGVRALFWLPWVFAVDPFGIPPSLTADKVAAAVKVGRSGPALEILPLEAAAYATTDPEPGQALRLQHGHQFKLSAAPAAGEIVYLSYVPVIHVFEQPDVSRAYEGQTPLREPRAIRLTEADRHPLLGLG